MPEILIIEDSESDAALLQRALRAAGVSNPIQLAFTASEALALLHAKQKSTGDDSLAVVFIDLKLPRTNGLEILKLMQGRTGFLKTLAVVISSVSDMENIKQAYSLGADSFISKPISSLDINELIRSFPGHWLLSNDPAPASPSTAEARRQSDLARGETAAVWARNREIIQKLGETLEETRRQIDDHDETFAIIETLTEELRNKSTLAQNNPHRKKSRTSFIL